MVKSTGNGGLEVKDVYLIAMEAIKIIGKEHVQWRWEVEEEYLIAMESIKTFFMEHG